MIGCVGLELVHVDFPLSPSLRSHQDILHLLSPSLKEKWRDDGSVVDMLETTFTKFLEAYKRFCTGEGGDKFPDHFHCRYLEIYEQDDNCGTHLFQLKVWLCTCIYMYTSKSCSVQFYANFKLKGPGAVVFLAWQGCYCRIGGFQGLQDKASRVCADSMATRATNVAEDALKLKQG